MRWDKKSIIWTAVLAALILAVNIVTVVTLVCIPEKYDGGAMEVKDPDRIIVQKGAEQKEFKAGEAEYENLLSLCRTRSNIDVTLTKDKEMKRDEAVLTLRLVYDRPQKARIALKREVKDIKAAEIALPLTAAGHDTVFVDGVAYRGLPVDAALIRAARDCL